MGAAFRERRLTGETHLHRLLPSHEFGHSVDAEENQNFARDLGIRDTEPNLGQQHRAVRIRFVMQKVVTRSLAIRRKLKPEFRPAEVSERKG